MTTTPIPAGSGLTIDDDLSYTLTEASSQTPVYFLRFEGRPIACMTPVDRARLLAGPPRPDGVPDELGEWGPLDARQCVACPECAFTFDAMHTGPGDGYTCPLCHPEQLLNEKIAADWSTPGERLMRESSERAHAEFGAPLVTEARTPPQPEPTASSKETDLGVAPSIGEATNVALVTEARTGPLGLSEGDRIISKTGAKVTFVRERTSDSGLTMWLVEWGDGVRTWQFPQAWEPVRDDEPQPADTLADIAADMDRSLADDGRPLRSEVEGWRDRLRRIEAASRPDPGTITVNLPADVVRRFVRGDFSGMDVDTVDMACRAAWAAAGLPREPTEG